MSSNTRPTFCRAAVMPDRLRRLYEAQGAGGAANAATAAKPAASPRKPRRDCEHTEQVVFFNRIRTLALNDASYAAAARRTFAIPNGGGRSKREAGRLKAEGVKSGVSDIFCSVARGGMHGLYIEMKSLTGYASREQREWISDSTQEGYMAATCRGAEEAFQLWKSYVDATHTGSTK